MLKAKESKGVGGGKRSKKSTHVRFFLPSSPPPPNLDDDDDDDDHADHAPSRSSSHYSPSLSSSTSSLRPPARAYPSSYSSSSSSSTSSQPPRRPPPIAPSSSSSSSSSRPPHRPPPAAPSSSSSSSSSSRVRLPPSSFSYLAPPSTTFGSSAPTSTASTTPRRGPPSTAFFAPPPSRPLLSTSSSSAASLPGSSSSASGMIGAGGWTRYRSAVDRASAAAAAPSPSSAPTADRRPSPPPPRWRDDTDVSSSSDDDRTLTDATTNPSSSSAASPPPPSMSATEGETTTDGEITHPSLSSAMSSGVSSSSSSSSSSSFGHSPVPSLSSPVSSPRAPAAASSTSPRRAPSPLASSSSYQPPQFPRPASPAPIEPAPTSFACARPFGGVKDVDDVAAALEAWLIPPALSRGAATNKKKTKIRFGVEVGRLSQPRCSLRVSQLTGTEGRRARKWADVRSNTVAVSFAFAVKEGVNVFELGELSGSIKNLLLLVGSDELDTDLESKLVDEGPGTSKILLLNLLFRDECLFHAISAVLAHHRIEQADASLLLSQSPADCRSRRARLEGIDARLVVDAVIGRSILGFVEELVANLRREAVPPASAEQEDENENGEKERRRSERESEKRRGGGTRRHRATKEEKRRVAGAMLRKYGQQLLGIPPAAVAGLGDVDAITRLVHLLRALNDIRFFVEFDSLDELVRRLWPTPGTTDNGGDAGPRRSLSEEGELLGAAKKAKKKTKTKTKNETTEDAKRKKKTKEKKKKRLSGSASKRQSADTARHRRNSSSSSSRRRDAVDVGAGDDDSEAQQWESYSWHSLHAYLLASYDQLVRQTTAAAASVDGDGDGDDHDVDSGARPRDMGREIEEGIVASVRDMMLKLQSLSTIHSVRAIAGDDVLLVACEGMDLFAVLPSPDEMVAIERAAKSEARRRKKKNESEANKKTKKEEERRKKKKTTKEMESGAVDGAGVRSSAAAAVLSTPGIPGMPSRPLTPPKRDKVNIKLMVLGDLRVGKTSLIQRFLRGSAFTMPKYKPTYAADFVHKNVVLRDKPRTLQIWDTSGNERQRAPDRAFFKGVDALVLVFDQRRASTFAPALDRHLDDFLAHAACPDPRLLPVVVIGNRGCEKNESESEAAAGTTGKQSESESEGGEREVRRSEVEAWCRGRIEGNRLFAYFEASAKEGAHVDDAFLHAANAVLDVHHGAVH